MKTSLLDIYYMYKCTSPEILKWQSVFLYNLGRLNVFFSLNYFAQSYVIKSGIHWYHCNPTYLWKFNFTLVRRQISALIWDISGPWNRSDGRDYREKQIVISRFLALYNLTLSPIKDSLALVIRIILSNITSSTNCSMSILHSHCSSFCWWGFLSWNIMK